MKSIKKLLAAIVAISLCASLSACSGQEASDETTVSSEAVEATIATTQPEEDVPEENVLENPLKSLTDAVISVGEWPVLWEVTDPTALTDFFLLDTKNSNYRNLIVLQCPMSAQMIEIIIIKADDVSAAVADLVARQKKAQEQDAFYPADIENAAASIVGSEGDYAYFILCGDPTAAEQTLIEAIKNL